MQITPIAVVLMRLFGVFLFLNVMIVLTELPTQIYTIFQTHVDYMKPVYALAAAMMCVRLFIYTVLGICLLVFARRLAGLFTRGLDSH
jgi:hypothetical protein